MSAKPRLHVAPPQALDSFGDLAADLAGSYGLVLDDWQQFVLADWLALDQFGLWASLTAGLSCPRQNGKNGILEVREVFGMVGRGEKILHTAHEVKTARKAFKRLQHFFGRQVNDPAAKFPELNARVTELRNVNGQEAIFLDNGGSVEIVARSKNSGRGFTADVLVMDEAQEMSEDDIEALMPTTSAAPLKNPQWIFAGTPPGPKADGQVFTRTRTDALSDTPYRICWHEWSACDPDDRDQVDPDDRATWCATNPALGGRLQVAVVEGERSRFSLEGFLRERLGVWDPPELAGDQVIPYTAWRVCADESAQRGEKVAYAIDAAPDGKSASIAASDGLVAKVLEHGPGTSWVAVKMAALLEQRPGPVFLDPRSPAGALIVDLHEAGIVPEDVSPQQHAQACGGLLAAVTFEGPERRFLHTDQPHLNSAVSGATRRVYGDAWAWSRRSSAVDISPLVAVTLARWAAGATLPVPTPGFVDLSDFDEG